MLMQFRQGSGICFFNVLCPFCLPFVTVGFHLLLLSPEEDGVDQQEFVAVVPPAACPHWWAVWVEGLRPL